MSNGWNGDTGTGGDPVGLFVFVAVILLALAGLAFLIFGSIDYFIVRQCERYGYWQTGQTRVLCVVDRTPLTKQEKLML